MVNLEKFQADFDVYSNPLDAKSKSVAMGLGGAIHVYDLNGQAYYMPGASHGEYLQSKEFVTESEVKEVTEDRMVEALRAVVAEILNKGEGYKVPESATIRQSENMEKADNFQIYGEVTKKDDEQRIVYGFASVVSKNGEPVVDRQGDIISAEMMEKAASDFMLGARTGLTMHKGEPTTTIIHSLPLTKQVKEAFQIDTPYEGWIIAVKVHDDDTWEQVKQGRFTGFSIGGRAQRREV